MTSRMPDICGGVDGHFQCQVAVCEAQHEVLPLLAEIGPHLSPLDNCGPVVGVDDLVPDIKWHTSPRASLGWFCATPRVRPFQDLGPTGLPSARRAQRGERATASVWHAWTTCRHLTGSELFSSLDAEALARVAGRASTVQLDRNDTLFNEGDEADDLFVVLSGRVAIAKRSPDGRESLVALMEPGDLFGEMPLFDDEPVRPRPGRWSAPRSSGYPSTPFGRKLEARPSLLWDVVALFATRLRAAGDALADAMLLDVTGRTAKRLLELSGDADEFVLPITQEELAGLVGASRERVNKAIAAFVRLGWIDQTDRRYRVVNRERLAQRAG